MSPSSAGGAPRPSLALNGICVASYPYACLPSPSPPPTLSSPSSDHVPHHQARIQEAAAELHLRIPDTSGLGFIQSPRAAAVSKAAAEKARAAAAAAAAEAEMEAAGSEDEDDASALMHEEEGEEGEEGSEA